MRKKHRPNRKRKRSKQSISDTDEDHQDCICLDTMANKNPTTRVRTGSSDDASGGTQTRSVNDINDLLLKVSENQESMKSSLEKRISDLETSLRKEISTKMESFKKEFTEEIGKMDKEIKTLKTKLSELEQNRDILGTQHIVNTAENSTQPKLIFKNVDQTDLAGDDLREYIDGIVKSIDLNFDVLKVDVLGEYNQMLDNNVQSGPRRIRPLLVTLHNNEQRLAILQNKRKLNISRIFTLKLIDQDMNVYRTPTLDE